MKFIIAPVYTVYERSVHPHYPQGFPQVLGRKTPVWQGFPQLYTPRPRELSYIFHRPQFLFFTSIEKSVCSKTILRRRRAQFCQNRRFPHVFPAEDRGKKNADDCKSRGIFYKCIAFSSIRFIHLPGLCKQNRYAWEKNAAAHVLRRTCAATAKRSDPARPLRRASGDRRRRNRSSPRCPYTGPRAAGKP